MNTNWQPDTSFAAHEKKLNMLLTLANDLRKTVADLQKRVEYLESILPYPKEKERT
jgi:hypothetical protein